MGDIVLFFISIVAVGIMLYLSYRAIQKSNSLAEKISEITMAIVMATLLVIYYLDRYNIPTRFNFAMNINPQNWLSFIGNYITGIISAVIGALVAVWTTIYQIKKNNEESERRNKENLRIQNMPIIKYNMNTEKKGSGDLSELIVTNQENEKGNVYNLNILLKNIGQNTIKDIIIDFKSAIINNSTYRLSGKDIVNAMETGEILEINRFFSLNSSDKPYEIILNIYYQDVLSNWYKQEILVYYNASSILDNGGYVGKVMYKVKKEIIISENEIQQNVI